MKNLFFLILAILIISGCDKDKDHEIALTQTETFEVTELTTNSAVLTGSVAIADNATYTNAGFCLSKLPMPDLSDSIIQCDIILGNLKYVLTGLEPATAYYYRTFATNDAGTAFGEEKSFTTLEDNISLAIVHVSAMTDNATVTWEITNTEQVPILDKGICFDTATMPTTESQTISVSDTGTHFETQIDNLLPITQYYVRAFATTENGTTYSEEVSFTTVAASDLNPHLELMQGSGYTYNNATIIAGETLTFGIIGTKNEMSGADLTRFKFTITESGIPFVVLDSTFNSASFNLTFEIPFVFASVNQLEFKIYDSEGNTSTINLIITVLAGAEVSVNKYTNVEIGSFNDATGSFYSSSENLVYTVGMALGEPTVQEKIDFIFFKGATVQNAIAAPDNEDVNTISTFQLNTWAIRNNTRFQEAPITIAQFEAIGTTYVFPEFLDLHTSIMTYLEIGDIIYFKTAQGKRGFVLIKELFSRGDKMIMDVLIEE